jgi:hypothetical protein
MTSADLHRHPGVIAAAERAGIIDPDALQLIDLRGVIIEADGRVAASNVFARARDAKPHLFKPDVRKMTDAEYAVAERELLTANARRDRDARYAFHQAELARKYGPPRSAAEGTNR